jgi:hypothetical protein
MFCLLRKHNNFITLKSLKTCIVGQGRQYSYGVDPAFGRRIEVDLSEERMKKAWEAYKVRWAEEEERRQILEEKKLVQSDFCFC